MVPVSSFPAKRSHANVGVDLLRGMPYPVRELDVNVRAAAKGTLRRSNAG